MKRKELDAKRIKLIENIKDLISKFEQETGSEVMLVKLGWSERQSHNILGYHLIATIQEK